MSADKAPKKPLFDCPECDRSFIIGSLRNHLFYTHSWSKQRISLKSNELSAAKYGATFECPTCHWKYKTAKGLKVHEVKEHNREFELMNRIVACPFEACEQRFASYLEMGIHAQKEHTEELRGQPAVVERKFASEVEVNEFLDSLRISHGTQYVTYASQEKKIRSLRCCHSGAHPTRERKQLKRIGKTLRRVVDVCTAHARISTEDDGSFKVLLTTGHRGHDVDHARLDLSQLEKRKIADMLKAGTSSASIINTCRDHPGYSRLNFLTTKDIHAVRNELMQAQVKEDPDDITNILLKTAEGCSQEELPKPTPESIARRRFVMQKRGLTSKRQTLNHRRHRMAVIDYEGRVKRVDGGWEVLTDLTDKEIHLVTHVANCKCKGTRCRGCEGVPCPCSFSCTCPDKPAGVSCSHIHSVALFCKGQEMPIHPEDVEMEENVDEEAYGFNDDNNFDFPMLPVIKREPQDTEDKKKEILEEFEKNVAKLRAAMLSRLNDDQQTEEEMDLINKKVRDIVDVLREENLMSTTASPVKENNQKRNQVAYTGKRVKLSDEHRNGVTQTNGSYHSGLRIKMEIIGSDHDEEE